MTDYLDFELGIYPAAEGYYQVLVLEAPQPLPPEGIQHFFQLPYDPTALARILAVLSGGRNPRGRTRQEIAKEFGESLFKAVFGEPIYQVFRQARIMAEGDGKWLRVRLNLKGAGQLAGLPWEYLCEPSVDFLTLSKSTPIIRYTNQLVTPSRMKVKPPLRILVMISNPADVPPLDETSERNNLLRAVIRLQERGLVEVEFLEDASLRNLQRTLRQKDYHVFHYIGHSAYDAETNQGILIFEDPYDHTKAYPIRGEALARELHEEETIRLVVLNSCQGAVYDGVDPYSGVATSLLQRGIPAVVAQQFEISDRAAILFSEEFYRAVAEGFPLEAAVAEGRRAILSTLVNQDNIEWGTPVLFLYDNDSQKIFDFPPPNAPRNYRQGLPWIAAALVGVLLLFLIGAGVRTYSYADDETPIAIPPPTATPIPNVDLSVREVRLSPRSPKPGELVAVSVEIENKGGDAAPPFTYEWQGNLFDPTTTITRRVGGLAAGGVLYDSFTVRYGWWGVFISETRLDTQEEIAELSEQNKRPLPVRTDNSQPFVIDFGEPLPNGQYVRGNMPVPFDAFDGWGFRLEAHKAVDPACREVVPWFKFIGISKVALGTGLPNDPDQCADAELLILFFDPRPDNNLSGVSRVTVEFAPGAGGRTVEAWGTVGTTDPLVVLTANNSRTRGLSLTVEPSGFANIYQIRIKTEADPTNISRLILTAP